MAEILTYLFWHLPVSLLIAEGVLAVYLSRKKVRHRLLVVIGSYLLLVGAAMACAFIRPDEFGFSFIPVILLTAPWYFIPGLASANLLAVVGAGAGLNCAVFAILDKLSYSRGSAGVQSPHMT